MGEHRIQLAPERPYYIVAPAPHETRQQAADLLTERLAVAREAVTKNARFKCC